MKFFYKITAIFLSNFLFSVPVFATNTSNVIHSSDTTADFNLTDEPHDRISLNFYQTDIAVILQAIAESRGLNLVMSEAIDNKQTVKLNEIEWRKAMDIILKSANLEAEFDENIMIIKRVTDADEHYQKQLQALKNIERSAPLDYLSLKVNHADLTTLMEMIQQQKLLTERGSVVIDKRTNALIIKDIKKQFKAIQTFVNELDKPMPQVKIAAHIVTINSDSLSELGIKWGYSGDSSQLIDKFSVGLGAANATSSAGFNLAKRSGNLLNLELSALESENQLEIIATPNLLTANQNMASIKQGTEIPYEVSSGNSGQTSIEFKQAVLGLEVTPKILTDNKIMLDLLITQNTAGRSIKRHDGGEALAIDTQEIKTEILVQNGETVVLGGIFQQLNSQSEGEVPTLSQIPLIGDLFKNRNKKQQKRELVIFITPQLIE